MKKDHTAGTLVDLSCATLVVWRWVRLVNTALLAFALDAGLGQVPRAAAQEDESPASLVYLRDIDASILQDIRYAGPNNFTGQRVPGYAAAECMLLHDVAEALSRVQKGLLQRKLSLKVYDCYRPQRAVRAFVAWVGNATFDPLLRHFHPNLDKNQLIDLGYIASVSRHSRGDTVDLTLVALPAKQVSAFKRNTVYGPCSGPVEARSPDSSVDMGTGFDCFDPRSHTRADGLTDEQQRWRQTLVEAMARQNFRNYHKEWWHFTFTRARRGPALDVPIAQRKP